MHKFDKNELGYTLRDFSQTHLVTLFPTNMAYEISWPGVKLLSWYEIFTVGKNLFEKLCTVKNLSNNCGFDSWV
jgi:hypothetical protein